QLPGARGQLVALALPLFDTARPELALLVHRVEGAVAGRRPLPARLGRTDPTGDVLERTICEVRVGPDPPLERAWHQERAFAARDQASTDLARLDHHAAVAVDQHRHVHVASGELGQLVALAVLDVDDLVPEIHEVKYCLHLAGERAVAEPIEL